MGCICTCLYVCMYVVGFMFTPLCTCVGARKEGSGIIPEPAKKAKLSGPGDSLVLIHRELDYKCVQPFPIDLLCGFKVRGT